VKHNRSVIPWICSAAKEINSCGVRRRWLFECVHHFRGVCRARTHSGSGKLLRRAIEGDKLSSVIFYGPPGTGKTALANIIAGATKSHFQSLNAVTSGVADIRRVMEDASDRLKMHEARTILFIDEVHRFNKTQQDALLPAVENGTVILSEQQRKIRFLRLAGHSYHAHACSGSSRWMMNISP